MNMKLKTAIASPAGAAWLCAVVLASFQACGGQTEEPDDQFGGGPRRTDRRDASASSSSSGGSGGTSSSSGGPAGLGITQISSLVYHTCAVWNDGVLKCWGMNAFGALGLGDTDDRGDGPGEMGENLPAVDVGQGRRVRRVSTGYFFTCALLDDSTVKCWGDNPICGPDSDQNCGLGYGDQLARGGEPGQMGDALPALDLGGPARDISCGTFSCCAVLANDAIKCWGENTYGVLGYGDQLTRGDEPDEMGAALPTIDVGVSGVSTLKTGNALINRHACTALKNGEMKCWGNNTYGQLGIGDTAARGDQLNEMGTALPRAGLTDFVTDVAPGDYATCALTAEGLVRCWGDNAYGQLGYGDTTTRGEVAGQNFPIVQLGGKVVSLGLSQHACAVLETGEVKCWGANQFVRADGGIVPLGRLGYGDFEVRGSGPNQMGSNLPAVDFGNAATARSVALGSAHTCVQFIDGKVKCFGENNFGALGLGDGHTRGVGTGEMGDALPFVDLGR